MDARPVVLAVAREPVDFFHTATGARDRRGCADSTSMEPSPTMGCRRGCGWVGPPTGDWRRSGGLGRSAAAQVRGFRTAQTNTMRAVGTPSTERSTTASKSTLPVSR